MEVKNLKIAIIGGGNLGRSVADGFLKAGIAASKLTVSRRRVQLLDDLAVKGIRIEKDNRIAVAEADMIIIAVKPYQAVEVISEIKPVIKPGQLVASLMTGDQPGPIERVVASWSDSPEDHAQYSGCTSGIDDHDISPRLLP